MGHHNSEEAKYKVFLDSRDGLDTTALYYSQNNYPETNLYRSFPFSHSPIPLHHDKHSYYQDDVSNEEREDDDAWYNDINRTVRLAAQQREEMIDLTNEANMLDFMAALRKHDYKGLKE